MNTRSTDNPSFQRVLNDDEFRNLKVLGSCAVANAIERFHVQLRNEGYTEEGVTCRFPEMPPVLGYAMTLKVRSGAPPTKGKVFFENTDWWNVLLAVPSPRILVIQDMDRTPGVGALVGGVHAAILKSLGCIGVVTNGAVRDLSRIQPLGFQMFSGTLSVSHAYSHLIRMGGPVQIGGLEISPGDLLHGDLHGIVRVPKELAGRIPATAAALRQKEEGIIAYCQSSDFTVEGLRGLLSGE
ncbi:MAG TPA: RraA family protein [Candidatus Methylacidiphilales bacterium]|jgi:regulator of RNase E activity RraA|nr:RraA family protein [Candidatus Methylacidiphilales bacterium]